MNNIGTNLPPCDGCNQQKYGVTMDENGILSPYCIVCSGDIVHTAEARAIAESLSSEEPTE